jgi:hypothetical protein
VPREKLKEYQARYHPTATVDHAREIQASRVARRWLLAGAR